MRNKQKNSQRGFTIVELLIATVIFSIILLICMQSISTIGQMFYKGVTLSRTGEAGRSAMDTIENDIRFTQNIDDGSGLTPKRFCIGDERYTYYPGIQVLNDPTATDRGLVRQQFANFNTCKSGTSTLPAIQMLGSGMRLTRFEINNVVPPTGSSYYTINITIANTVVGDDNALVDSTGTVSNYGNNVLCKQGKIFDTQFCSSVKLSTSVIVKGGYN